MQITNTYGVPETIVRAILDDEYDRGDSVMSITQLISPPRVVLLQDLNANNLTVDVVNRVPALLGTAVHKIIEKGAKDLPGHLVEERLFATIHGWKISGAVDLQIDKGDGSWEINDYKVTSVYSVLNDKPEWEQQLNCYAYLAHLAHGRSVKTLKIVAILRDWQRKQAQLAVNYPPAQIQVVDIPVWPLEQQKEFLESRVLIHQAAKKAVDNNEPLTYCSDQERWLRNEAWAVMKEGRKSAVKLHDSEEEARRTAAELGGNHRVEHRAGTYVRCEGDWCMVARFCRQWQESHGNGAGDGAVGVAERHDE